MAILNPVMYDRNSSQEIKYSMIPSGLKLQNFGLTARTKDFFKLILYVSARFP